MSIRVYKLPNIKNCVECGDEKDTDKDFYPSKNALDKRINTCKECICNRHKKQRAEKLKERELYAI